MKELIEKFEKETGLEFYTTSLDKGEDLYNHDFVNWIIKQLPIHGVVKSLPTEQCVRDWWKEGADEEHFFKHTTSWSNEQVFKQMYQCLTYFINRWQ